MRPGQDDRPMMDEDKERVIDGIKDYLMILEKSDRLWVMERLAEEAMDRWREVRGEVEQKQEEHLRLWAESAFYLLNEEQRKNLRAQMDDQGEITDLRTDPLDRPVSEKEKEKVLAELQKYLENLEPWDREQRVQLIVEDKEGNLAWGALELQMKGEARDRLEENASPEEQKQELLKVWAETLWRHYLGREGQIRLRNQVAKEGKVVELGP